MGIDEIIKLHPLGSTVIINDTAVKMGMQTQGMRGCVLEHDVGAGVCVRIFLARFFEPVFWYQPAFLTQDGSVQPFLPATAAFMEEHMDGRKAFSNAQIAGPIMLGALRTWLVGKARGKPGDAVYEAASKADWTVLKNIYTDSSDSQLSRWLSDNDIRARRPVMTPVDVELAPASAITRPKLV